MTAVLRTYTTDKDVAHLFDVVGNGSRTYSYMASYFNRTDGWILVYEADNLISVFTQPFTQLFCSFTQQNQYVVYVFFLLSFPPLSHHRTCGYILIPLLWFSATQETLEGQKNGLCEFKFQWAYGDEVLLVEIAYGFLENLL